MSGDRACFSTGNRTLLDVCVCVYTYCVFGHGGQPRRTVCICLVFKDVIRPHVRVIQAVTMAC